MIGRSISQDDNHRKTYVVGSGYSGNNGYYATLEFNPTWGDSVAFSSYHDGRRMSITNRHVG